MIIFLNGTSSVGKSTLARAIMQESREPLIYYSSDHIVNFWLDQKFFTLVQNDEQAPKEQQNWFCRRQKINQEGQPEVVLDNGPAGIKLYRDIWESAGLLIDKGYSMIIDEVVITEEQLGWLTSCLQGAKVMLIKVTCEQDECDRREQQRGDRYPGLSRGLKPQVDSVITDYDLTIDTTNQQPRKLARIVLDAAEQCRHQAFNRLRNK